VGVRAQVRELLHKRIRDSYLHPQFNTDVMKPLNIEALMDQQARRQAAALRGAKPRPWQLRACCVGVAELAVAAGALGTSAARRRNT